MATQTYEQLIAGANKIKENELPESNTHDLVGEQLLQMTNKMQEESTKTDNSIMEYNVSKFYPTSGIGGTNKYTLETAIALVPEQYRSIGIKCSFINEDGKPECWEYQGGRWITASFVQIDSGRFEQLGVYTDNSEFVYLVKDAEDRILFGLKRGGKPYFPQNELYHVIQNEEFLILWMSGVYPLMGIRRDGSFWCAKASFLDDLIKINQALNNIEYLKDTFSILDNNEFVHAVTDNNGRILFGIRQNGSPYFPNNEMYHVTQNEEFLAAWVDAANKILFGVKRNGKFYTPDMESNVANRYLSVLDDPEGRQEMTLDNEGRILSYRDKEGVKHETKLDVAEFYQNGVKKEVVSKEDLQDIEVNPSDINIDELDGVSDHDTPNLLIPSEMGKTFNDGTNSFTPPNEGYEMSNPIECKAGDWFTRTGVATAMIVVTDNNDKNGQRIFNAENTFQIPLEMTWARYVRMAAQKQGALDGQVVICKGKKAYTGDDVGDFMTIDKLKIQKYNMTKELMYLKTSDGKYWELYIDEIDHSVKCKEIDPEIITDLPADFKPWTLSGSFEGQFDRMLIQNNNYFIEIKATGVVKYKNIGNVSRGNYANFEHFYSPTGEERYGFVFASTDNAIGKGFTLFDKDFNILDTNIGMTGYNTAISDMHDFIYLADDHILLYTGISKLIRVPGMARDISINGPRVTELKKQNGAWKVIGEFKAVDYPQLCTDAFGDLGSIYDVVDSHSNTISLDYDGHLLINCRNWETWIKIRRVDNGDGTVTLGSATLDYAEAIIGRVGGRHNSGYIDSKRVLNDGFSFVDVPSELNTISEDDWEEWQWFHSHDVKYWGEKEVDGKKYPTYTLFDNNYWTDSAFKSGQYNVLNKNNNVQINPQGAGNYYSVDNDSDENYAKYTHSRVIQLSIDWDNHKIMDYRVYYIPKVYSREQSGATMLAEGIISIAYSYAGEFGLWDFTTESTEVSGHIYKGAKELFKGRYDNYRVCYRANVYKIKK